MTPTRFEIYLSKADSNSEIKLFPGIKRRLFLLITSSIFVAMGILLITDNKVMLGVVCAAVFSVGIAVSVIEFLPNGSYLILNKKGFQVCSIFRKHSEEWKNVKDFRVVYISCIKTLGYNFTPEYRNSKIGLKLNKIVAGYDSALPHAYGLKPEQLLVLANKYLEHATASGK